MKLGIDDVPRWLAKPLSVKAVLAFGEDRGGVAETIRLIAAKLVPDLSDPFRVSRLDADDLKGDSARLNDELGALSVGGGRLVWLRDATDRHMTVVEDSVLGTQLPPGHVLLIEAGALTFRSSLRKLFEGQPSLCAINCDTEMSSGQEHYVRDLLKASRLRVGDDALGALMRRLGPDRAMTKRAVEVLALYMLSEGPDAEIAVSDVLEVVGDAELLDLDDVIAALLDGALAQLDRALTKALAAGASPVAILRAALRHFQRLHLVVATVEAGGTIEGTMSRLVPPVPYSMRGKFLTAARRWTRPALERALTVLDQAEMRCKTTGLPESVICADALSVLARFAGGQAAQALRS